MILPDVTVTKACAPACGWAPPDVETELGAVAGVEAGVDAGADAGTEEGAEDGAEAGAALLRFRTVTWTGCALAPPIYFFLNKFYTISQSGIQIALHIETTISSLWQ